MHLRRRAAGLAFVAAVLCWSASSRAGVRAAGPATPPVFGTDVSVVLLPVFVADGSGRAVPGLRSEDFVVQVDGKQVDIVSFRYVDTRDREDQEDLRVASAARRRFLLLFDKSFTDLAGLARAQRAAADFVRRRLAPSDLAAVATFDVNRGVRMVANFTEDRGLLAHAVATLGVPAFSKISDPLALAADLSITDVALSGPGTGEGGDATAPAVESVLAVLARQMRSAEMHQYRAQVGTLVDGLSELARGLRRVDGRKQILYFSAGFDSRLLTGEEGSEQRGASRAIAEGRLWEVDAGNRYGDSEVRAGLDAATRALSLADAVVHTIDVTGLSGEVDLGQQRPDLDSTRVLPGRESLNLVAANTGGRFFKDANDLKPALDEMLEMTSRYYVLGVQPRDTQAPGAFRKLKVKLARKGVRLSHRGGYYERTPPAQQTPLQRQFEAAQLLMAGVGDAELGFASLILPFPERGERQSVGIVVQLPREQLRWTAGHPESLEFYGYAVDESGAVRDHLAQLARLDPGEVDPQGERQGVSFFGTLRVPPGVYSLRLMLHERESGRSGRQVLEVTVPRYDPEVGFLLPPVVMDDPGRWVSFGMGRRGDAQPYPFQVEGRPFLPRASSAVSSGVPERMALIAYEPRLKGDPAADLQIWTSLVDEGGGRQAPGPVKVEKVLNDELGRRTYVIGYVPSVDRAGDYTLRVSIGEAGALLESYARLRVGTGS
ncbi:MAG: VWA domain-containing protein [Vicinamibacteria bacterium]